MKGKEKTANLGKGTGNSLLRSPSFEIGENV